MNDQFLIEGLTNRNKVVFDFIFNYYYSGLCAYCEQLTRNRQASEDIVQDLFVTLWVKHKHIKITSSLKNYLFAAVRNRSIDFLKQEKRKNQKLASLLHINETEDNLSDLWFTESELQNELAKVLEKLPPRCREIFEMSRFKNSKNKEIAENLGLSIRTVELQIHNAIKNIRIALKPYLTDTISP